MLTSVEIARMSSADRFGESMRRSLPHLPVGAQAIVKSMLKPEALAIMAGTLVVWAGSHLKDSLSVRSHLGKPCSKCLYLKVRSLTYD